MPTLKQASAWGRERLQGTDSPDVDVQVLLSHVMECSATTIHMWPEREMTASQWQQFEVYIAERLSGRPVAHIIGYRGFWSLDLAVDDSTLIPRPDTELLVSLALPHIKPNTLVADLGTGSGAIALALASEKPNSFFIATDYSMPAVQLAQRNAKQNQITNIAFVRGSWLRSFRVQSFDLIISNPPYIEDDDPHLQQGDVRFEPLSALIAGTDGLDDIRQIIVQATSQLKNKGWLLLEHGYDQSARVQALMHDAGFENIQPHQDFGGQDRAVMGQLAL